MMEDRDFYALALLILGLSLIGVMQARLLERHQHDLDYLMDNALTRTPTTEAL